MDNRGTIGGAIVVASIALAAIVDMFELWERIFPNRVENVAVQAAPKAIISEIEPQDTPPEQHTFSAPITELLASLNCQNTALGSIVVDERVTPPSESTSGFEGHYLEGYAVLKFGDIAHKLRIVGSGKGPAGALIARDVALRDLAKRIHASEEFSLFCKED